MENKEVNEKEECGFENIPVEEICHHPSHNPPMHLCIPTDQVYRHICPSCGYTVKIRGNPIRWW